MDEFDVIKEVYSYAINQNIPRFEQNIGKLLKLSFEAAKDFNSFDEYYDFIMNQKHS